MLSTVTLQRASFLKQFEDKPEKCGPIFFSTTMIAEWIPGEFSQGAGVNGKSLRLLPDGWMRQSNERLLR